jgi:hypothetical protein
MTNNNEEMCQEFARIIGGEAGFAGGKCVATINRDEIKATILGKRYRVTASFSYESLDKCGDALCLGRIALLQSEVTRFIEAILCQKIMVSSIHNEWLCDDPSLIFVNIQTVEEPLVFARKVRKALKTL